MPFDPNIPQPGQSNDADVIRDQLNGLKVIIDALAAQLTAQSALIVSMQAQIASILAQLTAFTPSHEAVGFGEPGACGKLTMIGMFAGKPMYQEAGGWYYCWNPDGGMWICRDALPGTGDLSNNRYADSGIRCRNHRRELGTRLQSRNDALRNGELRKE